MMPWHIQNNLEKYSSIHKPDQQFQSCLIFDTKLAACPNSCLLRNFNVANSQCNFQTLFPQGAIGHCFEVNSIQLQYYLSVCYVTLNNSFNTINSSRIRDGRKQRDPHFANNVWLRMASRIRTRFKGELNSSNDVWCVGAGIWKFSSSTILKPDVPFNTASSHGNEMWILFE